MLLWPHYSPRASIVSGILDSPMLESTLNHPPTLPFLNPQRPLTSSRDKPINIPHNHIIIIIIDDDDDTDDKWQS